MNTTANHEFHPDAESLNAFAEQALAERERNHVLAHLAECGRCRQVVALAREAADAELAAPAAARHMAIRPDAWWKQWRPVWVPTAVAAAFAVASIFVYVHRADENSARINIADQTSEPSGTRPANLSQPEQAEVVPSSSPAATVPLPQAKKHTPSGASQNEHARNHEASANLDRLTPANSPQQPPPPSAQAQQLDAGLAPVERPSDSAAPSPASAVLTFREEHKEQEERRQQTQAGVESRRLFAAKMPPPASTHNADAPLPAATQTVTVTSAAPQLETGTVPASSFGAQQGPKPGLFSKARIASTIQLPSGLPAVSTAIAGHRMLAIDKAGALFLSEDAGNTWERVTRQWSGRAVTVRRHIVANAITAATQTAEQPEAVTGSAVGSPVPPVFFEILNDKNQVWLSTDGRLWIAQ